MKMRCVVVGNGMVGHHFVEQMMTYEDMHLTVIGAEAQPAYDRVHLSEVFADTPADELMLAAPTEYAQAGIELVLGDEVTEIDRDGRQVMTAQGRQFPYDTLVLATGSYPFVPPIDGNDLPGCLVYRTLEDLEDIKTDSKDKYLGVLVVCGLLGLV